MNLAKPKRALRRWLAGRGYNFYRMTPAEERLVQDYLDGDAAAAATAAEVPARLQELRARYDRLDLPAVQHSAWARRSASGGQVDTGLGGVDLARFRAQSAYVWAYADANVLANRMRYYMFADHVRRHDPLGLLDRLQEDGAYGCLTFDFEGLPRISRDLLDSVLELNVLQDWCGLLQDRSLRVLDVGAGYGRMAQRLAEAGGRPAVYDAVDAVAESTWLCEHNLAQRGIGAPYRVLPLDEFAGGSQGYDLALNIHSFSECTQVAIRWWLEQLVERGVQRLFLVPNDGQQLLSTEADHSRLDCAGELQRCGFRRVQARPMFADGNLATLTGISDWYLLYER
ncbi:MAG TPA: class I SAM-dependent methyltransferase [Solimonas sp.]|nr:class I SAM-dependent methyltransferase [Solimonas sp.]